MSLNGTQTNAEIQNNNSLNLKNKVLIRQDTNNNEQYAEQANDEWVIKSSEFAQATLNPVRRLIEQLKLEPNPQKQMIALSIGDPTILSELEKPDTMKEAIKIYINEKSHDGYTPSFGTDKARQAIAKHLSRPPHLVYNEKDIFLTHGCSHALDLAITVLASRGQNILIPRPGFSIYKTLCNTFGIDTRYYNLLPDNNWNIDFNHLKEQIDSNTVAIIINNPSNPCGSNYSLEHLKELLNLAKQYRLPIIADEVYGDMVFEGNEFYYLSELSDYVPILSCNAISKKFIMPGWRFGWLALHDPKNVLRHIRGGLMDLTTRILGPNSLVQSAVVDLLEKTPESYYKRIMSIVQENAEIAYDKLSKLPGISPKKPTGAMYMMIGIDFKHFPLIKNDQEFVELMVREQSVFCIPATVS